MIELQSIWGVLREIDDPEMPISIVDLGIVSDVRVESSGGAVLIDILPTFVGCPAQAVIEQDIRRRVAALPGVAHVQVNFVYDPPWSVDRISPTGRESLRKAGITVPERGSARSTGAPALVTLGVPAPNESASVACPICGATATTLESPFGPTRCKMIYYCRACRNQFEHMKRV